MPRNSPTLRDLLRHLIALMASQPPVVWLGEEVSASSSAGGVRTLRRIALATHHALLPHVPDLPGVDLITEQLRSLGHDLALSLADRTIGRLHPLHLEDTFEDSSPRLPEWERMLTSARAGQPSYLHRAIVSLVKAGHLKRLVTHCQDTLLETAAEEQGLTLEILGDAEGPALSAARPGPWLYKMHGGTSREHTYPWSPRKLQEVLAGEHASALRMILENHPLLMLGYLGPDPYDITPLLTRTRLKHLIWVDEQSVQFEVRRADPAAQGALLNGDFSSRLLSVHGGWRLKGRLGLFLELLCEGLEVQVPGPTREEEITAVQEVEERWVAVGQAPHLPPSVAPLARALRERWLGALSLLVALDILSESTLDALFLRRRELEKTLPDEASVAWLRFVLAQTGRPQVEAALLRHFHGEPVVPRDRGSRRRLERAAMAVDWLGEPVDNGPLSVEELNLERNELRFALTGDSTWLPGAAQAVVELPSATHGERWLRMKAAGAVQRRQWAVAVQELSRALAEGWHNGMPEMKLRARVGLAGLLARLLQLEEVGPLLSSLKALERRDPRLSGRVIDEETAQGLGLSMAMRLYEEALEGCAAIQPTLQPALPLLAERCVRLAFSAYGPEANRHLFFRDPVRGRLYSGIPGVEDALSERLEPYLFGRQGAQVIPLARALDPNRREVGGG